jgi:hypothetical protein
MINFNTDKLIIFYYLPGSGGKFVINTLGLSSKSFFQDNALVNEQLNGKFNKNEKLNLLLDRLELMSESWNDLNMGCGQLFGSGLGYYGLKHTAIINDNVRNLFCFNKEIESISNLDTYFFLVSDSFSQLEKNLKFWPNAKVIELVNTENFVKTYRPLYFNDYYYQVRGNDWPEHYPSIDEYLRLDESIKKNISKYFDFGTIHLTNIKNRIIYKWDVGNYFSFDKTFSELTKLLELLDINDVDENSINLYYNKWIDKISQLNTKDNK